jgi:hypothetical protein
MTSPQFLFPVPVNNLLLRVYGNSVLIPAFGAELHLDHYILLIHFQAGVAKLRAA